MDPANVEELREHFYSCPAPPDAGCSRCHAYARTEDFRTRPPPQDDDE